MFPVDHSCNRRPTKVRLLILDLTRDEHVQVFKDLRTHSRPCLRAREKPLPHALRPARAPQPLRDERHLEGLPGLPDHDRVKVKKANKIYSLFVWICNFCFATGRVVAVENPHRSWLWQLLASMIRQTGDPKLVTFFQSLSHVVFDACMHGGDRDKRTKFLCSPGLFDRLPLT